MTGSRQIKSVMAATVSYRVFTLGFDMRRLSGWIIDGNGRCVMLGSGSTKYFWTSTGRQSSDFAPNFALCDEMLINLVDIADHFEDFASSEQEVITIARNNRQARFVRTTSSW